MSTSKNFRVELDALCVKYAGVVDQQFNEAQRLREERDTLRSAVAQVRNERDTLRNDLKLTQARVRELLGEITHLKARPLQYQLDNAETEIKKLRKEVGVLSKKLNASEALVTELKLHIVNVDITTAPTQALAAEIARRNKRVEDSNARENTIEARINRAIGPGNLAKRIVLGRSEFIALFGPFVPGSTYIYNRIPVVYAAFHESYIGIDR